MKLLIEIPEEVYEHYKNTPLIGTPDAICWPDEIKKAVRKATLIPATATNEEALLALFKERSLVTAIERCTREFLAYMPSEGKWVAWFNAPFGTSEQYKEERNANDS